MLENAMLSFFYPGIVFLTFWDFFSKEFSQSLVYLPPPQSTQTRLKTFLKFQARFPFAFLILWDITRQFPPSKHSTQTQSNQTRLKTLD